MREPGLGVHAFDDRVAAAAVFDDAGAEVGEPVLLRVRAALVVDDHVVVVQVRHRAAAVAVQSERERADHVGLEVVHQVPADKTRRVRDPPSAAAAAASPTRPPATITTRGAHFVRVAVGVEVAHAACGAAVGVEEHAFDVRLRTDLAPPGSQRVAQGRDRIALGVDRAAEEAAEPAVVARGPAVVGDRVHAGRRGIRVVAEPLRGFGREHRAEHVGAGRHRVFARTPLRERVRARVGRRRRRGSRRARSTAPSRRSRSASRRCRSPRSGRAPSGP